MEIVLIVMMVFLGLVIFIVSDSGQFVRDWWRSRAPQEVQVVNDTLDDENIGPQRSIEKEMMIRELNRNMSEFLNVYDVE